MGFQFAITVIFSILNKNTNPWLGRFDVSRTFAPSKDPFVQQPLLNLLSSVLIMLSLLLFKLGTLWTFKKYKTLWPLRRPSLLPVTLSPLSHNVRINIFYHFLFPDHDYRLNICSVLFSLYHSFSKFCSNEYANGQKQINVTRIDKSRELSCRREECGSDWSVWNKGVR